VIELMVILTEVTESAGASDIEKETRGVGLGATTIGVDELLLLELPPQDINKKLQIQV